MKLVTAEQMRSLDEAAINTHKVPSLELMENAGRGTVEADRPRLDVRRVRATHVPRPVILDSRLGSAVADLPQSSLLLYGDAPAAKLSEARQAQGKALQALRKADPDRAQVELQRAVPLLDEAGKALP